MRGRGGVWGVLGGWKLLQMHCKSFVNTLSMRNNIYLMPMQNFRAQELRPSGRGRCAVAQGRNPD